MNSERLKQIEEIYHLALKTPVDIRKSFIKESCGEDSELYCEVESLLAFEKAFDDFIDTPPATLIAEVFSDQQVKESNFINKKVGHYNIKNLLGKGGMGEVYLAEDTKLNRKVAVKFLSVSFGSDKNRLHRFKQEAFAASALNHPNILTVYEFGAEAETNFLVTEYVEGKTLREILNQNQLTLKEIIHIAEQTAFALSAAHKAGIIHRDIKPENIMVRDDGIVKVLDFGLAKLIKLNLLEKINALDVEFTSEPKKISLANTDSTGVMGTVAYMSPEQTSGLSDIDGRTDIWSFGVVLYEMLFGKKPFMGATKYDVIDAILKINPQIFGLNAPEIPQELKIIIEKSLCKKTAERYQDIKDLLLDITNLKSELDFQSKLERSNGLHVTGELNSNTTNPQMLVYATEDSNANSSSSAKITKSFYNSSYVVEKTSLSKSFIKFAAIAAGILFVSFGIFSFYNYISYNSQLSLLRSKIEPMRQIRINTTGDVQSTAISPNGEFLAYVTKEGKKYSLKVKDLAENNTNTIIQLSEKEIFDPTYSPNGNELFFSQKDDPQIINNNLYKVSAAGGTPEKLIDDIDSIVSFNPNGDEIVFRRNNSGKQESSIIIAKTDGSDERNLAVRGFLEGFTNNPVWSADGKTIACVAKSKLGDIKEFLLLAINVADGKQTPIGSSRWRWTRQLQLNKKDNELILNAQDNPGEFNQFWRVSLPDGKVVKVTNDFNKYDGGILTADGSTLTAILNRKDVEIYVAPLNNIANAKKISTVAGASYYGLDWTPDGKIVFATNAGQHRDIWIMDSSGDNPKQLTNDNFVNYDPVVTRDGRFIVYNSEKTGGANVWRMNLDGTNPIQITNGKTDLNPTVTPDSRWIIYADTKLWKVSIDGGESTELTPISSYIPTVSNDGKYIGYKYITDKPPFSQSLSVVPISGGAPIKSFGQNKDVWRWLGDLLVYADTSEGYSNLFSTSLKDKLPKQLTDFKSDKIFAFAFSHDERQIAFIRGSVINEAVIIENFR